MSETQKKIVLIFGATGSIGVYLASYLKEKLSAKEFEIIAIGRRNTTFFEKYSIPYISADITEQKDYESLPRKNIFAAIHLANMLPARMKEYNPLEYIRINTMGTLMLLEYLRKVKADRILFTQTYADLAGHWGHEKLLGNFLPQALNYTGDHAVYAISKCAAVDLMKNYRCSYGLKDFVFRLPNIYMYSPEQYYYVDGVKTLISYRYMIQRAMEGLPIEVWGDPNIERDIVYVKDLCQMMMLAILVDRDHGSYNVGTGIGTTMLDQVRGMIEVFSPKNKKSSLIFCPEKRNSMEYIMDISNAKDELGYEPKYDYLAYLNDYKIEMNSARFTGLL